MPDVFQNVEATVIIYLSEMAQVVRFLFVFVTSIGIGVGFGVGSSLLAHELLVWRYGPDLSVIDNTPPMLVAVSLS